MRITKFKNNVLTFASLILILGSCENKSSQTFDYTCKRPADIPSHFNNGEPIPWDCRWHFYYKEGQVTVIRDSLGGAIAMAIHHKKLE
jgi:hypothetical protein